MMMFFMSGFIEKGYTITPDDFFVQLQVRYSPVFHFVWRVRVRAYEVDELFDTENIFSQIPDLGQRTRNDASPPTEIPVDMSEILTDVRKQLGYGQENFSHN